MIFVCDDNDIAHFSDINSSIINITHLQTLSVIISFETRLNIFLKDIFAGEQDILIKNC